MPLDQQHHPENPMEYRKSITAAIASEHGVLLSIALSIEYDIVRHREGKQRQITLS
jgi:hypothetical protein